MPYRLTGKNIEEFKDGKWHVKYRHGTRKGALKQMQALRFNDPDFKQKPGK